jgi:hypothetical protein
MTVAVEAGKPTHDWAPVNTPRLAIVPKLAHRLIHRPAILLLRAGPADKTVDKTLYKHTENH